MIDQRNKKKLLFKSLLFDGIGMLSMLIPGIGPFLDIVWAPLAAKKMTEMYPGTKGKWAAAIVFLEEILPYTDVLPTFTIMWCYQYLWLSRSKPIEVQ